jgi:hypothetical protein
MSAFGIDGRTDLSMVIYNPATEADWEKLERRCEGRVEAIGTHCAPTKS